jgi:hypothetical protein
MINLGKKLGGPETGPETAESPKKNQIVYPEFTVYDIDLGLGDEHAGQTFQATIKGVIRRVSKTARADGSKENTVSLEVRGIEFKGLEKSSKKTPVKSIVDDFYKGQ